MTTKDNVDSEVEKAAKDVKDIGHALKEAQQQAIDLGAKAAQEIEAKVAEITHTGAPLAEEKDKKAD